MLPERSASDGACGGEAFVTTRWSVVLAAGESASEQSEAALDHLCRAYWYPLYAFVRRSRYSPEDAEDLTQSFFEHLLDKKVLSRVVPDRGRFRSFLLASLKHFLSNEWDKKRAIKRGGNHTIVSLDEELGEERYLREPSHDATPEKLFEQSWALAVIDSALRQLRAEYAACGKEKLFELLQDRLIGTEETSSSAELAAHLGISESGVRTAIMRMRRHFGYLLRTEIAQTVENPSDIEEELRHLVSHAGKL